MNKIAVLWMRRGTWNWCPVKIISLTDQDGTRGVKPPPLENFLPLLKKCIGYSLKILDIFQKIWAPLRKLFVPPGVPR